jgi:hypothetical protein
LLIFVKKTNKPLNTEQINELNLNNRLNIEIKSKLIVHLFSWG